MYIQQSNSETAFKISSHMKYRSIECFYNYFDQFDMNRSTKKLIRTLTFQAFEEHDPKLTMNLEEMALLVGVSSGAINQGLNRLTGLGLITHQQCKPDKGTCYEENLTVTILQFWEEVMTLCISNCSSKNVSKTLCPSN